MRSDVGENSMLYAYFSAVCVCVCYRRRVTDDRNFNVRGSGFVLTRMHPLLRNFLLWISFGPVTLTLT